MIAPSIPKLTGEIRSLITQKLLEELFEYNKITGDLIWRVHRKGRKGKIGNPVGSLMKNGYLSFLLNGRKIYNHRAIWLWHYGYLPENNLDHINRDRLDNRIENLREVSHSCNIRNSSLRRDNISGIKGLYPNRATGKWEVSIKGKYLGIFEDFVEAVSLRLAAEQALDWSGCDSTSSAYLYIREYCGR